MCDLKKCSKCGVEKRLDEFYLRKDSGKHRNECKECISRKVLTEDQRNRKREYHKKWGKTERAAEIKEAIQKRYRLKIKNKQTRYHIDEDYREKVLERARKYREENHDRLIEDWKKWKANNPDKVKKVSKNWLAKNPDYHRKKRAESPVKRVKDSLSARIRAVLKGKGYAKNTKTAEVLGCDLETLKAHIESKFWPGMSWGNYGEWQIDHIKPLASAETIEDVYRLNHYSNLQPLWMIDNIRKGAKHIDLWPRSSSIVMLTETG